MKYAYVFVILLGSTQTLSAQIPPAAIQIKTALLAAPEASKEGAMVYGYSAKGEFVVLRKGTNEMICLADDPKEKDISVACYHKDLDPFMARGRKLKAAGKSFQEIFDIREAEAKSGKLKMPEHPSNLQVYSASAESYNSKTGEVTKGSLILNRHQKY